MILRDKTRRRLARTVLVLFGWAPFLLLVLIAFFIHGKTYDRWVETQLTNSLEMQVSFQEFEHPRWDTSRYEGVTLSDPETGEAVMNCNLLEVEYQHTGTPIPLLRIRMRDCRVFMDNSRPMWSFIERSFAHRRLWKNMQVEFSLANLSFDKCSNQTIRYMAGTLSDIPNGSEGVFAVYVSDKNAKGERSEQEKPARLKIARLKNTSPATTNITLDSTQCPLAGELLAYWFPPAQRLGACARFAGTFNAYSSGSGWDGSVSGIFNDVELNRIFVRGGKARCQATARLSITQGEFVNERLVVAKGQLDAVKGSVDSAFIDTLTTQLKFPGAGAFNPYGNMTPFQQLSLGFEYENEMVSFTGACADCPNGTILRGDLPLIRQPFSASDKTPLSTVVKLLNSSDEAAYIQIAKPANTSVIR